MTADAVGLEALQTPPPLQEMLWPADRSKDTLLSGALIAREVSWRWLSKPRLRFEAPFVSGLTDVTGPLLVCVPRIVVAEPPMMTFWLG
jgi:hypothetical protein